MRSGLADSTLARIENGRSRSFDVAYSAQFPSKLFLESFAETSPRAPALKAGRAEKSRSDGSRAKPAAGAVKKQLKRKLLRDGLFPRTGPPQFVRLFPDAALEPGSAGPRTHASHVRVYSMRTPVSLPWAPVSLPWAPVSLPWAPVSLPWAPVSLPWAPVSARAPRPLRPFLILRRLRCLESFTVRRNMLLARPVGASRYDAVKLENGHSATPSA
jgi:hypothetical protein